MSEWISVENKLPDNKTEESVLITNGKDVYVAVEWWPNLDPLQIDWSYSYCCGCKANRITHWMPLPEKPNAHD